MSNPVDGAEAGGVEDTLVGQLVADRYMVEAHMGEGGMGSVYRARHVTLDKLVALKVLHAEFSRKEDFVRRFLLEAKAASRIRNQHVIDITDFGTTDEGFVFFAMEFLAGKDLHGLLKETLAKGELLSWERSKGIFLQVCEALHAAHQKGIIHRDLKPENIFLVDGHRERDFIKLLDFGIAKVENSDSDDGDRKLTKTGMLFGTPEYMAPEQARGEKPDLRVDVYAMGCLLFQFITGTVPFQGESFMAILTQHMIEPVPEIGVDLLSRTGAPTGILAVIQKALVKNRDERYANIEELSDAVANVGQAPTQISSAVSAPTLSHRSPKVSEAQVAAVAAPSETIPPVASTGGNKVFLYGGVAAIVAAGGLAIALMGGGSGSDSSAQTPESAVVTQPAVTADPAVIKDPATPTDPATGKPGQVKKPKQPAAALPADAGVPKPPDAAVVEAVKKPKRPRRPNRNPDTKPDKKPDRKDPIGDPSIKDPFK